MNKFTKNLLTIVMIIAMISTIMLCAISVSAEDTEIDEATVETTDTVASEDEALDVSASNEEAMKVSEAKVKTTKAWAAGIAIGVVAAAGALAMGLTISKTVQSIARQPEAEGSMRTTLMLGLVFIETAIIYALIVAILIIFVL